MRTSDSTAFAIPDTRSDWVAECERMDGLRESAKQIGTLLAGYDIDKILSIGAGSGLLEYHLASEVPDVELRCSDYAPATVDRLASVSVEFDGVIQLDITSDAVAEYADHCFLINRVDTELSDAEWNRVFTGLSRAGVENVLFIASGYLTLRATVGMLLNHLRHRLNADNYVMVSYKRTRSAIESLWEESYDIVDLVTLNEADLTGPGNLPMYLLGRKN